jgi:hypothetical protein
MPDVERLVTIGPGRRRSRGERQRVFLGERRALCRDEADPVAIHVEGCPQVGAKTECQPGELAHVRDGRRRWVGELARRVSVDGKQRAVQRLEEAGGDGAARAVGEVDGDAESAVADQVQVEAAREVFEVARLEVGSRFNRSEPIPGRAPEGPAVVDVEQFVVLRRVEQRAVGSKELERVPARVVVAARNGDPS